jgi:hypothetical protein
MSRLAVWLAPVLLTTIAIAQGFCSRVGVLTPWKGGGFGMFSSIDHPEHRYLLLTAEDRDGHVYRVSLSIGRLFSPEFHRGLGAFPTETRLRQIADSVFRAQLARSTTAPTLPTVQTFSDHRDPLQRSLDRMDTLEVIRPIRSPDTWPDIVAVNASMVRYEFDIRSKIARLRPITSTVTVR